MSRQELNQSLLQTSFLYGANAAYIEELHARYEKDPASVDAAWGEFFAALKDDPATVARNAQGASWEKPNWPISPRSDTISALDGNWGDVEKVVGDKLKAKGQAKGAEVSAADIQRVAKKYLAPDQVAILVVGDWKTISAGDLNGRAKMADFFGGKVTHLPLRDPMTMEPMAEAPASAGGDSPAKGAPAKPKATTTGRVGLIGRPFQSSSTWWTTPSWPWRSKGSPRCSGWVNTTTLWPTFT
jgi:hypothetical protein